MEQLSPRQLDEISKAYQELIKIHPELKSDEKRRKLRATISGITDKDKEFHLMVAEAAPGESEPAIKRRVNELVALSEGRPAILIRNGDFDLKGHETLPDVLRELLENNRDAVKGAILGVGRIEVSNHPQRSWLGTGFVVAADGGRDIVVTNRHVAIEMAFRGSNGDYQFVDGLVGGKMVSAYLDLKEEVVSVADDATAAVPIIDVLHIEDSAGPDLAFLRLAAEPGSAKLRRLNLNPNVEERTPVAAIGYPAKDTRETDLNIVLGLLGDVYNKKRLAPGIVKSVSAERVSHDCSTLGGNSGSPLVDLRSGSVVGVHFGGTFPNPINHAVSSQLLAERLDDVIRAGKSRRGQDRQYASKETAGVDTKDDALERSERSTTIELPLRITVELGAIRDSTLVQMRPRSRMSLPKAVESANQEFGSLVGIADIRSGLLLRNGQYSNDRAIVVAIDHTVPGSDATVASLPQSYQSFPIEVRNATAEDLLRAKGYVALEGVPRINYQRPDELSLDAVEDEMFAVFHVSPDAGWPQLREFLSRTRESLTIGLYNFATEHVEAQLYDAISQDPRKFDLVLGDAGIDRAHTDEFEDRIVQRFANSMGERFRYELADGRRRLFAGHYHIKVAVRDSEAFWLSSGNWEPSNQPEVDPVATQETSWELLRDRNREWHAVVLNKRLSQTFESYIKYDLESYRAIRTGVRELPPGPETPLFLVPMVATVEERPARDAKYFAPLFVRKRLRIQPLLTPDNFFDYLLPLVESATESIELQNQTLKWRHRRVDRRFERFMNALLEKHRKGVRVRFILRSEYSPEMKELLIEHGFEPEQIRLQSRCHTKGMIVDSRRTLIGSHNLSEHGALVNRDASLIVDDEEVANYFRRIFQFDWDRASSRVHEAPPGILLYRPGDRIPPGYEVVSMADLAI